MTVITPCAAKTSRLSARLTEGGASPSWCSGESVAVEKFSISSCERKMERDRGREGREGEVGKNERGGREGGRERGDPYIHGEIPSLNTSIHKDKVSDMYKYTVYVTLALSDA